MKVMRTRLAAPGFNRFAATRVAANFILACLVSTQASALQAPRTQRVSEDPTGEVGNFASNFPSISGNGRFVVFASGASNLVPTDNDQVVDTYLFDREQGTLELVSVSSLGAKGDDTSSVNVRGGTVSSDGRYVVFASRSGNLVGSDTNDEQDVFLRDRVAGTTIRVSEALDGTELDDASAYGCISADGRYVAFRCDSDLIDPTDSNGAMDIYVRDMVAGTLVRASDTTAGTQSLGITNYPTLTADGRYVVYSSTASNLHPDDTETNTDIFVHDLVTRTTELISDGWQGVEVFGGCVFPAISADGRYVVFHSTDSNLVAPGVDTNNLEDIFLVDRLLGTTELVSLTSDGQQANGPSLWPSISPEGRHVAFTSTATNLAPGNGGYDCYVRDLDAGTTRIVSVDSSGNPGSDVSLRPFVATMGRVVTFYSNSDDLAPGPDVPYQHVYVHTTEGCPFPEVYCQPSGTSVTGCAMELWFQHAPQASSPQDFKFRTLAPAGNLAIGLVGISGTASLPLGTLGGAVCVQPPFQRLPVKSGGGDPGFCNGYYEYTLADVDAATPYVVAGNELFVQIWSRDPANADGFALSDAGRFTVCP